MVHGYSALQVLYRFADITIFVSEFCNAPKQNIGRGGKRRQRVRLVGDSEFEEMDAVVDQGLLGVRREGKYK